MRKIITSLALLGTIVRQAQLDAVITHWIVNPGGEIGYESIPSNVLAVLFDATGREVQRKGPRASPASTDVRDLPAGSYSLQVTGSVLVSTHHVIIAR